MVKVRLQQFDSPCSNGHTNGEVVSSASNGVGTESSLTNTENGDSLHKHSALEKIQENTQKIKSHLIEHASGLTDMLEELLGHVDVYIQDPSSIFPSSKKISSGERSPVDQDKMELFQISHIQSIYHIFVAVLVLLFLQTVLYDVLETGWIKLDFGMIIYSFGKMQTVLTVWLYMKGSVLLIFFPGFHYWANNRHLYPKHVYTIDWAFVSSLVTFFCLFMYFPVKTILTDNIPPASSAILMCEQVRLIMKSYAFVRTNWCRAKQYKPHQDGDSKDSPCPDFGKFLYFLFAPTLIYRDEYPRTREIRWSFVAGNFIQVVACLFYTYYVFERFCVPVFRRFGKEPFGYQSLLLSVFGCMMPGTLVLLIQFFAVLHCWMNAFAEMLRFGDRLFYKDWWNSKNYSNYYRTWNVLVHDWLYTYVYKDIYQFSKPDRQIPMFGVFLLSAVVHEYMVSLMFHFFYPILFFTFGGLGVSFIFLTKSCKSPLWNIFFWLTYFAGPGLLMTLYCLEIYARENCPPIMDSFLDFFIPRSWFCSSHEKVT